MQGFHIILPLLVVLSLLSVLSEGRSADKGVLLVANKADRTLGIVDPDAGMQVATVAEDGTTGHEVVASPDGRLAYVPIYGNSGVGKPGTDGRNMVVIDIATRKVVGKTDCST
jgi:DNA-binding beta-propeller fold protein YncE